MESVEYDRRLSAHRVFFGETVTLEVQVSNRKLLPLPWAQVNDEVPAELTFLKGSPTPFRDSPRAILSSVISLSWYHRLTRRYPVQCLKRGYFTFGPATLQSGDLFGFYYKETATQQKDYLLVYPPILPLEALGVPSRDPFGDVRVQRHLFEDPVRVLTTRDYVPGDPLGRVHWRASARLGKLQSRVFEPTTSVDLALFFDVRTVDPPFWGRREQLLETGVLTVAAIANYAVEHRQRIGLYVNDSYRHTGKTMKVPPSEHAEQFARVMETLAHVQGFPISAIEDLLIGEGRALPWRTTLMMVTAAPTDRLLSSLRQLRRVGRRVALVLIGEQGGFAIPAGYPVYHVLDEVPWREMTSVTLSQVGREA